MVSSQTSQPSDCRTLLWFPSRYSDVSVFVGGSLPLFHICLLPPSSGRLMDLLTCHIRGEMDRQALRYWRSTVSKQLLNAVPILRRQLLERNASFRKSQPAWANILSTECPKNFRIVTTWFCTDVWYEFTGLWRWLSPKTCLHFDFKVMVRIRFPFYATICGNATTVYNEGSRYTIVLKFVNWERKWFVK